MCVFAWLHKRAIRSFIDILHFSFPAGIPALPGVLGNTPYQVYGHETRGTLGVRRVLPPTSPSVERATECPPSPLHPLQPRCTATTTRGSDPPPRRTKHGQSIPCSCPYLHQLPSLSHSFSKTRIITASSKNSKFPNLLGLSPVKISGPVDGSQYTSWTLVETECSLPQKKKCKKERGR